MAVRAGIAPCLIPLRSVDGTKGKNASAAATYPESRGGDLSALGGAEAPPFSLSFPTFSLSSLPPRPVGVPFPRLPE